MQTPQSVTLEEVVARAVLNPALYDRIMSESDTVAAATTGLSDDDVLRLRRVLSQIRTASGATAAAVDRVTRAADRTMQK
jgi:hypothetical protein